SFNPGIQLVLDAYDGYWRKVPSVKRLVFKSVPDESTRLVMLKRGETDLAFGLRGPDADEARRTPGLTLKVTLPTVSQWVVFTQQWDPRSPWADRRIRLAVNLAIDARLRPMERASFYKADQDKQFKHLVRVGSGAAGNAATRIEAFVISGGIRSYGGYPDIDSLFRDQAGEMDRGRREQLLHKIQQLMYERAMFAPIVEQAALTGAGPRMAEVPPVTG